MQKTEIKIRVNLMTTIGVVAISYLTGKAVGFCKGYEFRKNEVSKKSKKVKDEADEFIDSLEDDFGDDI